MGTPMKINGLMEQTLEGIQLLFGKADLRVTDMQTVDLTPVPFLLTIQKGIVILFGLKELFKAQAEELILA